jgi:hypothetical protein
MKLADPLTPAVELESAVGLMARQAGVTNKPEMGLIVELSQGMDQTVDATGKATGAGVRAVALKRAD